MRKLCGITLLLMLCLTGCASQQPQRFRGYNSAHKKLIEVDAQQKISGKAYAVYLLGFLNIYDDTRYAKDVSYYQSKVRVYKDNPASQMKAAAAYKALKANDTDILLSPTYIIETNNYLLWKTITATVIAVKGDVVGYQNLNPPKKRIPCLDIEKKRVDRFGG